MRFAAGSPGTYLYGINAGTIDNDFHEREQLSGALVIDSAGARTDDRIFVINIWGETIDSVMYRNAVAIDGKSWPYTERITATVGDSLRWRVINGSARDHPMHLHGFYFRIDARGTFRRDTIYSPAQRRLAVTESLNPGHTMAIVWAPAREGNWLFHCHIGFHVLPLAKDGADLPLQHAIPTPAAQRLAVGETFDFAFLPPARGDYVLTIGAPEEPPAYVRRVIVR